MKYALVVAAMLVPPAAQAAPTFLTCTLETKNGPSQFDVQLNEEAGTVSYFTHRTQMTVRKPAIFTPEKVNFFGFEINRRSLSFQRDNTDSAFYNASEPAVDVGKCVLDRAVRAF
jgi:hypothetical protein